MRLVNNNYKHTHLENSVKLWAHDERQPWDKDSGYEEKKTVKGSMSAKEMNGFREKIACGMKDKK